METTIRAETSWIIKDYFMSLSQQEIQKEIQLRLMDVVNEIIKIKISYQQI